ncbi:EAL domain-containing protein [Oricola cellulosilytica]|uniref:EAL domain-containing protein n=1 Tax=Oricola cellulosilytica TaxID=1429082 RepID=A0A4R0PET7_9HYPH|nr:EAL domain-containing protein [Oricola cellulosilytica]TCD15293.1 EAL domain-containing protein [Oricola cellulosilytica]
MKVQIASRIRTQLTVVLLALPLAAFFIFASHQAHVRAVEAFNRHTITAMTKAMLRRSEIAIDYAIIELAKLLEAGRLNCDPSSVKSLEQAVFLSGSLKSIIVNSGDRTCNLSSHVDFLKGLNLASGGLRARNPKIFMKGIKLGENSSVTVTWELSSGISATALINTDALVFDILPWEWRSAGKNELTLTSGEVIATYRGAEAPDDLVAFRAASERYPLVASISVPQAVISEPGNTDNPGILSLLVIGSIILGYLVARGVGPGGNPAKAVRTAIHRGEIVPYFQPSYDLRTREITGFEVLARWPQKDGGMIPPATFIPTIEAHGWGDELLSSLIAQTAVLMRDLLDDAAVTFAFNVTSAQICAPDFPDFLSKSLNKSGFPSDRVIVEITERGEITDHGQATTNIAALGQLGVRCAIDDTGTGHNGLAAIQKFGAAILKIDKLFVDTVDRDRRSRALVRTLVSVAAEYGMRTIAEGIETPEQLSALKAAGVDEAQGFYLCRPVEAPQATVEFTRNRALTLRETTREHQSGGSVGSERLKSA